MGAWTRDRPKEPGWYWCVWNIGGPLEIHEVTDPAAAWLVNVEAWGPRAHTPILIGGKDLGNAAGVGALRNATPELAALAQAVEALLADRDGAPWWTEYETGGCFACAACMGKDGATIHADGCWAMRVDSAFSELLAALA